MGFALKLYGERTFHDLELLRKLRNLFAHGRLAIDFNTPGVKWAIIDFTAINGAKQTQGSDSIASQLYF